MWLAAFAFLYFPWANASMSQISEQENSQILESCGISKEPSHNFEQTRWNHSKATRRKQNRVAESPSLVHVYNRELGYSCVGVNISPRHVLVYSACLRTSEAVPSISRIRDVIELRHYYAQGDLDLEFAYNISKVVNYIALDVQQQANTKNIHGTFAILEREINYVPISTACIPPSYQFPQSPDKEPLGDRKMISFEELCDGTRECSKRFLGRRVVERGRLGRAAVYVRAKSMSMYDTKSEIRDIFVGFLTDDNTILSVIPYIFSICMYTGVCHDEFNQKANPGYQYRGEPSITQVLENGVIKQQHNVQQCTDKITKLDEHTFTEFYERCGQPMHYDELFHAGGDHNSAYSSSIHAQLRDDLTLFVCGATLISEIHAIASRQCDFDAFERGGLFLLYGDQYEDPISTHKKSVVKGYLYLAEYGISILELAEPVEDHMIPCFPSIKHLARSNSQNPMFDEVVIELKRGHANYYVSECLTTWIDKPGTPTLLVDMSGYVTLTGIRLRG